MEFVRRLKTEFANNVREASRKIKIARSVLQQWRNQEAQVLEQTKRRARSRLPGGGRKPFYPLLEAALKEWFDGERGTLAQVKRHVSWRRFYNKALELQAKPEYGAAEFKCSEHYITLFMKRQLLSMRSVTHQAQEDNRSLDVRQTIAREYLQSIQLKTVNLDDSFIVNMDETPIYIDMASNRTISYAGKRIDLLITKSQLQLPCHAFGRE